MWLREIADFATECVEEHDLQSKVPPKLPLKNWRFTRR
jgi:hypothetical protein